MAFGLVPPAFAKILPWRLGASAHSELVSSNIRSMTRPQSRRQRRRSEAEPKAHIVLQAGTLFLASPRLGTLGPGISTFLANSTRSSLRWFCKTLRYAPGGLTLRQRQLRRVLGAQALIGYTRRFCGMLADLLRVVQLVVSKSLPSLPWRP